MRNIERMLPRPQHVVSSARMGCIALALLAGISAAHASSPDAWNEFRDTVQAKCVAAASNAMTVSHIQVDPYGSEKYGIAILTGKEKGSDEISHAVCIFEKQTEHAEIGTMMPKDAAQKIAAAPAAVTVSGQCEIFTEAGFKGASGVIAANDLLRFQPQNTAAQTPSGITAQRVFFDESWRDNIGSVKASPTCTLVAWDVADLQGPGRPYRGEVPALDVSAQGKMGAAFCSCQP